MNRGRATFSDTRSFIVRTLYTGCDRSIRATASPTERAIASVSPVDRRTIVISRQGRWAYGR
ncbi:MAG TPA: hypothetical protein VLK65_02395 [Vicinamibacteria bacterium]|nr:hypothetical protein [Vicinamibacteria bacterium]